MKDDVTPRCKAPSAALRAQEEDRTWAEMYCAFKHLRYLSHERYGDKLHIAVEAPGERYEVTLDQPRGLSAAEAPCADRVTTITPPAAPVDKEGE